VQIGEGLSKLVKQMKQLQLRRAFQHWHVSSRVLTMQARDLVKGCVSGWLSVSVGVRRREGCQQLVLALTRCMYLKAVTRLQRYMTFRREAESFGCGSLIQRHYQAALLSLHSKSLKRSCKALLSRVLVKWHCFCDAQHECRQLVLSNGLRQWRDNTRNQWAKRRQLVIADLIAIRRHLKSAFLPWRLLCLADDTAPEILVEQWSDVTTPLDIARSVHSVLKVPVQPILFLEGCGKPQLELVC